MACILQRTLFHLPFIQVIDIVINIIIYMCLHVYCDFINCISLTNISDAPIKSPTYLVAVHRKCVRQETYFLSQHKSKPSLFGVPLLLGCDSTSTCQSLYEVVWGQVTRLLSPLPQSDQTNHATDW